MSGWTETTLSEVCVVFGDGDWIETKDQSPSGIRLVQTGNVGSAIFKGRDAHSRYVSTDTFSRLNCTEIFPGDCLVSRLPDPVGRACLIPDTGERMITAVDCTIIRTKKETLLPEFFVYFTLTSRYQDQVQAKITGTTRDRISRSNLGAIRIPLPPLSEQECIVSRIDSAIAKTDSAQERLDGGATAYREFFEAEREAIFTSAAGTCGTTTLSSVLDIARGGSPRPIKSFLTTADDGINWVKISDATKSEKYIYSTDQKISPEGLSHTRLVQSGDFLLSNSMSFGRPYIMRTTGAIHDGWLVLRDVAGRLDEDYLYYLLGSSYMYEQFDKLAAGSTVRNLNISLAGSVKIPVPPLNEQIRIAARIAECERASSLGARNCEDRWQRVSELRAAVVRKAFAGDI